MICRRTWLSSLALGLWTLVVSADEPTQDLVHEGQVQGLAFAPDGTRLAVVLANGTGATAKCFVVVWNLPERKELHRIAPMHSSLRTACFAPDGKSLAIGALEQSTGIRTWDLEMGQPRALLPTHVPVTGLVLQRRNMVVALRDGSIRSYSISNNSAGASVRVREDANVRTAMAMTADGALMAAGTQASPTVKLWRGLRGDPIATLQPGGETAGVLSIGFFPDGKKIAVALDDGVLVWDVEEKKVLVRTPPEPQMRAMALAPDGTIFATAERRSGVTLWDATTGRVRQGFATARQPCPALAFAPDGKVLAAGGSDGIVRFLRVP